MSPSPSELLLLAAALVGHVCLWFTAYNRSHGAGLSHRETTVISLTILAALLGLPVAVAGSLAEGGSLFEPGSLGAAARLAYLLACLAGAMALIGGWLARRMTFRRPALLLSNDTQTVDVEAELGHRPLYGAFARGCGMLPGNQVFRLAVNEKQLVLPRLDPALDGLAVVHLTDLHCMGRVGREYFEYVCRRAVELEPDLIAVTGDLVDRDFCIDWMPQTLGRLQARHGVYFVRGNHDHRVDHARLVEVLSGLGLVHLGGQWRELEIRGRRVELAGNELPWFAPAPEPPRSGQVPALRMLLAHTPDQIEWARRGDFDLMLAGHTHGGQIVLPVAGAIVNCSRFGQRYVSGVYHEPPTVLHTSRGVSGMQPLRFNCPPELSRLVLRAPGS